MYVNDSFGVFRYDREETELTLDNVRHLVKLHDTAGQEDYERLRKMVYKDVRNCLKMPNCKENIVHVDTHFHQIHTRDIRKN